jgi:uncharacterized SAM-binding protein YcdF (DUF218 family)
LLLWALSSSVVGHALLSALEAPPADLEKLKSAQAIVVIGGGVVADSPEYGKTVLGGESLRRVRYAAYLARALNLPVLASSGNPYGPPEAPAMADALRELGVQPRWIESASRTTAENAVESAKLLGERKRIALVTTAWHMPRARRAFQAAGFEVLPAPTAYIGRVESTLLGFLPSAEGLQHSRIALREYLGMAYYRLTGKAGG